GAFFDGKGSVASFDGAGANAIAAWAQLLSGDFQEQVIEPNGQGGALGGGRSLWQADAQDTERVGKGELPRIDRDRDGGLSHHGSDQIMSDEQAVGFLDDAGRGLAAQFDFAAVE